jgi:hypothetical protein
MEDPPAAHRREAGRVSCDGYRRSSAKHRMPARGIVTPGRGLTRGSVSQMRLANRAPPAIERDASQITLDRI